MKIIIGLAIALRPIRLAFGLSAHKKMPPVPLEKGIEGMGRADTPSALAYARRAYGSRTNPTPSLPLVRVQLKLMVIVHTNVYNKASSKFRRKNWHTHRLFHAKIGNVAIICLNLREQSDWPPANTPPFSGYRRAPLADTPSVLAYAQSAYGSPHALFPSNTTLNSSIKSPETGVNC